MDSQHYIPADRLEVIIKKEPAVTVAEELTPIPSDLDSSTTLLGPVLKLEVDNPENTHEEERVLLDLPPESPPHEGDDYILPDRDFNSLRNMRKRYSSPDDPISQAIDPKRVRIEEIEDWSKFCFRTITSLEEKSENNWTCKFCSKRFRDERDLQIHVRIHQATERYDTRAYLGAHDVSTFGKPVLGKARTWPTSSKVFNATVGDAKNGCDWKDCMMPVTKRGSAFQCKLCFKTFLLVRHAQRHVETHIVDGELVYEGCHSRGSMSAAVMVADRKVDNYEVADDHHSKMTEEELPSTSTKTTSYHQPGYTRIENKSLFLDLGIKSEVIYAEEEQ